MKEYRLRNLDCAACAVNIERGLSALPGVKFVSVNFAGATMRIDAPDIEEVKLRIREIEPDVGIDEGPEDRVPPTRVKDLFVEHRPGIIKIAVTLLLLAAGMMFEEEIHGTPFRWAEFAVYLSAWLISGWGVLTGAARSVVKGKVFNEHVLMAIATIGALSIDAMAEAVAVMLFYVVGELFQGVAINRSRRSIRALLEVRPEYANLVASAGTAGGEPRRVSPSEVSPGQSIVVRPGEKIPLDGTVTAGNSFVDTSALTGESVPRPVGEGDPVLAGMMNQGGMLTLMVTKRFGESSISRILELVETAAARKADTEKFITTFARYYTPVVVLGALLLAVVPPLVVSGATFTDWLYRALVVLVVSCPCALVISIPLGYFGGVGGASRRGILVKGSNYLDALANLRMVVFDKTGTLTRGDFRVAEVVPANGFSRDGLIEYAAYAEANSSHPIAKSIMEAYGREILRDKITGVREISGHGIEASVSPLSRPGRGAEVIVGNDRLLHLRGIEHGKCDVEGTVVHVTVDGRYAGYIVISDSLKEGAAEAIEALAELKIGVAMLTGDNRAAAEVFAGKLGIGEYYSDLLPEDKVGHIEKLLGHGGNGKVAFVGDGINDAPVLARADVGIAMGALGSDAAVETADVVLMTDSPMQVVAAIGVAKRTRTIVWQNIAFALGVKLIFIVLGVLGVATMWEAVFGDMGVAIIAILNAMRILRTEGAGTNMTD